MAIIELSGKFSLLACFLIYLPRLDVSCKSKLDMIVLLDKILLDKNPTLADDFYNMIDSVGQDWILKFMRYAGLQDDELWKGQHRRFMKARFLETYTSLENVVAAVEGVCRKLDMIELNEDQRQLLIDICEAIQPELERSIDALEIQLL